MYVPRLNDWNELGYLQHMPIPGISLNCRQKIRKRTQAITNVTSVYADRLDTWSGLIRDAPKRPQIHTRHRCQVPEVWTQVSGTTE